MCGSLDRIRRIAKVCLRILQIDKIDNSLKEKRVLKSTKSLEIKMTYSFHYAFVPSHTLLECVESHR